MNHRGFASDNNAGVLPEIMDELKRVNTGHTNGYGDDVYTELAIKLIKKEMGISTEVFFVYNGTGANVISLQAMARPFEAVICAETAHINVDECGAPEKHSGCKLIDIPTPDGKLTPNLIEPYLNGFGFEHHVQPKVISITQSTELGTIYSIEEIKQLSDFAHKNGLLVHMDGARISNAVASLNCSLSDATIDAGVDVLSFGGTKNGMMFGEAVLVFNPDLSSTVKYIRKQTTQLHSKMRFISAQFAVFLNDELWRMHALHANKMALLLANEASKIKGIKITQKVQANGVFAIIPNQWIQELQKQFFFYVWDENKSEVRWMTAFDTTEEDVYDFVTQLKIIADKFPAL